MAGRLKSKVLFKVELQLLRRIPILLAVVHFTNTVLSYFGIDNAIFSYLGGVSLLPLIFLYISSYTFGFCSYHRLFLHYVTVETLINMFDMYFGFSLDNRQFLFMNCAGFVTLLCVATYQKYVN